MVKNIEEDRASPLEGGVGNRLLCPSLRPCAWPSTKDINVLPLPYKIRVAHRGRLTCPVFALSALCSAVLSASLAAKKPVFAYLTRFTRSLFVEFPVNHGFSCYGSKGRSREGSTHFVPGAFVDD